MIGMGGRLANVLRLGYRLYRLLVCALLVAFFLAIGLAWFMVWLGSGP